MKSIRLIVAALLASSFVHAGEVDGSAVLGSALGAAAGSAIGSAIGGKEGAVIGGGAGGAIGAAVASDKEPVKSVESKVVIKEKVIIVEGNERHDNGKHKGQHKNKNKHKHGKDD
jgi:outer membrane lipoprotein SlyB